MRNTDPDPRPFQPLGEKVKPPAPASEPTWRPKPNAPRIEIGPDDRMRTNIPENEKGFP